MNSVKFIYIALVVAINFEYSLCRWNIWNKDLDWWQTTTLYQIYPRSFQDSDGDGIGDLKGIESRLDHFVETGIKTIWLSPIYKSPMNDLGYDVSDYEDIDPIFGTLDDFRSLINAVKKRGLYLLMDLVPNHSSDDHEWFKKSVEGIPPYTDYYIWRDGKRLENGSIVEPNNWLSLFGGSAWTWNEKRQQYYYHVFNMRQPDLNFRNANVKEEMKKIIKFWLDLGVDGFRVDAIKYLLEDPDFRDENCLPQFAGNCENNFRQMDHSYTSDLSETYDVIVDWRKFVDEYKENSTDKHTRAILVEAYSSVNYVMAYYGNDTHPGAHSPFNFNFVMYPRYSSDASLYLSIISMWIDNLPEGQWGNWVTGNHDNHRVATRLGNEMVNAFFMISMLLPGTAVTYQGEEIGQPDTLIRPDQVRDPNHNGRGPEDFRDPERGLFLWNDSDNAGFSTARQPWEPVHPSYWEINLEAQKRAPNSHYKIYKQIIDLRKTNTIQRGSLELHNISRWVFGFTRRLPGNETYVVVINVGSEREVITLGEHVQNLPSSLNVVVSSINSGYKDGQRIDTTVSIRNSSKLLVLRPKASVVLSTSPYQPPPHDNGKSLGANLIPNKMHTFILILASIIVTFFYGLI